MGNSISNHRLTPQCYLNYVSHPKPEVKKWAAQFRQRFRMPYESFLELVEMVNDSNLFDRWKKTYIHAMYAITYKVTTWKEANPKKKHCYKSKT